MSQDTSLSYASTGFTKTQDRPPYLMQCDCHLEKPSLIKCMTFRNQYAGCLSVYTKSREGRWVPLLLDAVLMPNPHVEDFALRSFRLTLNSSEAVQDIRILLSQSSPLWKQFCIQDIKLYSSEPSSSSVVDGPSYSSLSALPHDAAIVDLVL